MKMAENEEFCSNCKKHIASKNFVIHSAHCERKIQLCRLCNEPIPRTELNSHLNENHSLEDCSFCCLPYERWKFEQHKEECFKRPVCCEFCKSNVIFEELNMHQIECGSRTEKCVNCNCFVKLSEKINHPQVCQKNESLKTLIICKYCELECPPKDYPEHDEMCGSRSEKCHKCDEFVTRKNIKNHQYYCGKDVDCGNERIACESNEENKEDDPRNCPYCHVLFPINCLEIHIEQCIECTKLCQYCSKQVKIVDEEQHKKMCMKSCERMVGRLMKCTFCQINFKPGALDEHELTCPERIERCSGCDAEVMIRDKIKHKNVCELKCIICTDIFPSREIDQHYANCFKANSDYPHDFLPQTSSICQSYKMKEPLECYICSDSVPTECYESHIKTCRKSFIKCTSCQENVHKDKGKSHMKECRKRRNVHNINVHSGHLPQDSSIIPARSTRGSKNSIIGYDTKCPYCQKNLPRGRLQNHKKYCEAALKVCFHCEEKYHVDDEINHLKSCDVLKCVQDDPSNYRDSNNRFTLMSTEDHMREYETSSKVCQYCKCKIPRYDYEKHVEACYNEFKQCKFCEENIPKNEEKLHMESCTSLNSCKEKDSVYSGTGAKPKQKKNRQIKENRSGFSSAWKAIKDLVSVVHSPAEKNNFRNPQSFEKGIDVSSYLQSEEQNFIPCEFCGKQLPLDEGAITIHESGCRPEMVSYPQAVIGGKEKTPDSTTTDKKRDWITHSTEKDKQATSEIKTDYSNCISQSTKGDIDNYNFMTNFQQKYNGRKSESLEDAAKEKGNDESKMNNIVEKLKNDVMRDNTEDHIKRKEYVSEYLERTNKSMNKKGHESVDDDDVNISLIENNEEKCEKIRENKKHLYLEKYNDAAVVYSQQGRFAKPGEFLNSDYHIIHPNSNSAKHSSKAIITHSNTENGFIRKNLENIKSSHKEISNKKEDSEHSECFSSNTLRNTKYSDRKSCESDGHSGCNDDGHEDFIKNKLDTISKQSNLEQRKNSCFALSSDEESLKLCQKSSSEHKSNMINSKTYEFDDFSIVSSSEIMKGAIKIERFSLTKTNTKHDKCFENAELNKVEDKVIPEKERVLEHNRNYHNLSNPASNAAENYCEKIRISDTALNTGLPDVDPINENFEKLSFEENHYNQNKLNDCLLIETNVLSEQPMEIVDEYKNSLRTIILGKNDFKSQTNNFNISTEENVVPNNGTSYESYRIRQNMDDVLSNMSDSETKDPDLESYFQFLENGRCKEAKVCSVCGNEVCFCEINRNLMAAKSHSYSENFENSDFRTCHENSHEVESNKWLDKKPDILNNTDEKNHVESHNLSGQNWRKWRKKVDDILSSDSE